MTFFSNEERDAVIEDQARQIMELKAHLEQVPLEAGTGGGGEAQKIYKILDGQTLPPANIDGVFFESSEVTLVIDDPTTGGARGDGMGRAEDMVSGEKIMIVHDSSAPYGTQTAHRAGDYGVIVGSRSVTVGADTTVYNYIARF